MGAKRNTRRKTELGNKNINPIFFSDVIIVRKVLFSTSRVPSLFYMRSLKMGCTNIMKYPIVIHPIPDYLLKIFNHLCLDSIQKILGLSFSVEKILKACL